jgi:FMN phosphatase YigB (HAD superfamily)
MVQPKALLFDLGNVLLPIDLSLTYEAFAVYSLLNTTEIADKIHTEQLWVSYEAGLQTDEESRSFLRDKLVISCSDAQFDDAFSALLLGFHPGVYDWISSLKSTYQLLLLSNTSSIHAKRFTQVKLGPSGENLVSLFHYVYYSFAMGLVKPDPRIYQRVLQEQGLLAEQVLFFDDNVANINSARELGLQTCLVDPQKEFSQLQEKLETYVS